MPYPTGVMSATGAFTWDFLVPLDPEDPANNWLTSALIGQLNILTNPDNWENTPGNVTPEQAAAIVQQIVDSINGV